MDHLAQAPSVDRADLLERVVRHKTFFFASSWAHYETLPGSFWLVPSATRVEELRKDYLQMQAMIFGEAPEWDEIIRSLADLEWKINGA
jgi:hypothetical protein